MSRSSCWPAPNTVPAAAAIGQPREPCYWASAWSLPPATSGFIAGNLVGMGILPLQFAAGQTWQSLGLTGEEIFDVPGLGRQARAAQSDQSSDNRARRQGQGIYGDGADRFAGGNRLLPQRRHFCRLCCGSSPPRSRRCFKVEVPDHHAAEKPLALRWRHFLCAPSAALKKLSLALRRKPSTIL